MTPIEIFLIVSSMLAGLALEQADKAVILLSETVGEAYLAATGISEDPQIEEKVQILCERSQRFQEQIEDYLLDIATRDIDEENRAVIALLSAANTAFGRIGKVAERIYGLSRRIFESADELTETDRMELNILGEAMYEIMQLTIRGFTARTPNLSRTISYYTEEVMMIGEIVKKHFIQRLHSEGRKRSGSTLHTDICYAEEQLVDYCDMIAEALIHYDKEMKGSHGAEPAKNEMTRRQVHEIFRDKFEALGAGEE